MESGPEGLEDASKYPELVRHHIVFLYEFFVNLCNQIAELYRRNWTQYELAGLTGGNLLRVMEGAEKVAKDLQRRKSPGYDLYSKRTDIPMHTQGL